MGLSLVIDLTHSPRLENSTLPKQFVFQKITCKIKSAFIFPIISYPLNNYVHCSDLPFFHFSILHVVHLVVCCFFYISRFSSNLCPSFGIVCKTRFLFSSSFHFLVVCFIKCFPFFLGCLGINTSLFPIVIPSCFSRKPSCLAIQPSLPKELLATMLLAHLKTYYFLPKPSMHLLLCVF